MFDAEQESAAEDVIKLVRTYLKKAQNQKQKAAMKRLLHKAMTILLSGAVLASSVLPPAVCHAHAEGNRSHSHDGADEEQAADEHHHHGHHHHHHATHSDHKHDPPEPDDGDGGGSEPAVAHLHFLIAGFDFSWPLPSDNGSSGPLTPATDNAGFLGVGRLTDDTIAVTRIDLSSAVDVSFGHLMTIGASADAGDATARWLRGRVDRTFLCDSARCERSGVLRIFD